MTKAVSMATGCREAKTHICLTIAGSDSSGGAGIQADIKTFSALGVYGASAITALTAQNTQSVKSIHEVSADFVTAQLRAVLEDLNVAAIKIGMLASARVIAAVAAELATIDCPIVLDPVMVAKSGDLLLRRDAITALKRLLPKATLVTPNLPEAAALLQREMPHTEADIRIQAQALLDCGAAAVLLKGGHANSDTCVDLLVTRDGETLRLSSPRVQTRNTHGTGCTLSAAIAAELAKGRNLFDAVRRAHNFLQGAIRAAQSLHIGLGHGPVHHFHEIW